MQPLHWSLFKSVTKYHGDSYNNEYGLDNEARFNLRRAVYRLGRHINLAKVVRVY